MKNKIIGLLAFLMVLGIGVLAPVKALAQSDEDALEAINGSEQSETADFSNELKDSSPAAPAEEKEAPHHVAAKTPKIKAKHVDTKVIDSNPPSKEDEVKRRARLQKAYQKIASKKAKAKVPKSAKAKDPHHG